MNEPFQKAVNFAALKHQGQLRKDGKTPYIAHPFRVSLTLRHVFGVEDEDALVAAILHDVIEDTSADFDEVEREFGTKTAEWVALLSKDARLPKDTREPQYEDQIVSAPVEVQLVKLADLYDNILDSRAWKPNSFQKVLDRAEHLIGRLQSKDERLTHAIQLVRQLIRDVQPAREPHRTNA
jgi:guanosine-3',5'-bis(diphosphate) 3'-pyrophosphohydrolase